MESVPDGPSSRFPVVSPERAAFLARVEAAIYAHVDDRVEARLQRSNARTTGPLGRALIAGIVVAGLGLPLGLSMVGAAAAAAHPHAWACESRHTRGEMNRHQRGPGERREQLPLPVAPAAPGQGRAVPPVPPAPLLPAPAPPAAPVPPASGS